MSSSRHRGRNDVTFAATSSDPIVDVSRRAVLAGTAATTAVAAALPLAGSAYAQAADPKTDMVPFLLLSAALTGVHVAILAPEFSADKNDILNSDPGVDPIKVKDDYFVFINAADKTSSFGKLMQIARDHRQSAEQILNAVQASDDNVKFLARSIALLWYLGSWYEPDDLKKNAAPGTAAFIPSQVVSARGYTQGLVWQIAQAHPMGFSNLQFGYWSREPVDPNDQTVRSDLGFITATIP